MQQNPNSVTSIPYIEAYTSVGECGKCLCKDHFFSFVPNENYSPLLQMPKVELDGISLPYTLGVGTSFNDANDYTSMVALFTEAVRLIYPGTVGIEEFDIIGTEHYGITIATTQAHMFVNLAPEIASMSESGSNLEIDF